MRITHNGTHFIFIGGALIDGALARMAGFDYDPILYRWLTPRAEVASKLIGIADDTARNEIKRIHSVITSQLGPTEENPLSDFYRATTKAAPNHNISRTNNLHGDANADANVRT